MEEKRLPLFVGVDTVKRDLGVSRAKAYEVIKELNAAMKAEYPKAIVVAGKVNRIWYEQACLRGAVQAIDRMCTLTRLSCLHRERAFT